MYPLLLPQPVGTCARVVIGQVLLSIRCKDNHGPVVGGWEWAAFEEGRALGRDLVVPEASTKWQAAAIERSGANGKINEPRASMMNHSG